MNRIPLWLAVAVTGIVLLATPASAHANLQSSDPANGATLQKAPDAVTMTFTEPPDPTLSVVSVLDPGGNAIPAGSPQASGRTGLRVTLPSDLGNGTYTVNWRVISRVDGHLTAGVIVFGIGTSPGAAPTTAPQTSAPGPSVLSVVGKVLLYAGLMLLVALAAIGLGAFRGALRSTPVVAMIGALLALGGVIAYIVAERSTVGVPMGQLLRSGAGRPLVWLLVAVLVADAFAVVAAARPRWRTALWAAGAAAAGAMLVRATGSHAAAAQPAWTQEGLQWVHLLAVGAWIGGVALLLLLLRELRGHLAPVDEARRFSNVALVAVGVVVLTGSLRAIHELGGLRELAHVFSSSYGTVLTIKVAIAVGLIALGAVNRQRSIPRLADDPRPLRRVASIEVVAAVGVLALTGTLTGLSPPVSTRPPANAPPTSVTVTGSDFATTLKVTLNLDPGTAGMNTLTADVLDYDSGAPADVDEVDLRIASVTRPEVAGSAVPLSRNAGGSWTTRSAALSFPGTWSVIVVVRTGARSVQVPLTLQTRVEGATVTTSAAPGQPTLVTTTFPEGSSIQTYVDPGSAGVNQVHVTAFAAGGGSELPLQDVTIVAIPSGAPPHRLGSKRLDTGHFVANAELERGDWTFDVVADARNGKVLEATWSQTLGAGGA